MQRNYKEHADEAKTLRRIKDEIHPRLIEWHENNYSMNLAIARDKCRKYCGGSRPGNMSKVVTALTDMLVRGSKKMYESEDEDLFFEFFTGKGFRGYLNNIFLGQRRKEGLYYSREGESPDESVMSKDNSFSKFEDQELLGFLKKDVLDPFFEEFCKNSNEKAVLEGVIFRDDSPRNIAKDLGIPVKKVYGIRANISARYARLAEREGLEKIDPIIRKVMKKYFERKKQKK